jgi:geranylgeranyl pyrophosphate synthase
MIGSQPNINNSENLLRDHLGALLDYVRSTEKKGLRARILNISCVLDPGEDNLARRLENCRKLSAVIEDIHQGSLIVDDIQDSSCVRRGRPSLHVEYGIPLALNAGNFLYFSALREALQLDLPCEKKLSLQSVLVDAMAEAHEGQALDLGVKISGIGQTQVAALSHSTAKAKTGALVRAAFAGGYLLNSLFCADRFGHILRFGETWGAYLQKLDDIGHYLASSRGELPAHKAFEDFRHDRPTWIWGLAASKLSAKDFAEFRAEALRDPTGEKLRALLSGSGLLAQGVAEITRELARLTEDLVAALKIESGTAKKITDEISILNQSLVSAYAPARYFAPEPRFAAKVGIEPREISL